MSDGTVRGTFDLNTPALRKLREMRKAGAETDAMMRQLGGTMDRLVSPTALRKLDTYRDDMRKVGTTAVETSTVVTNAWESQRRGIEKAADRIELRVGRLEDRVKRYGRTRASATVDLNGFDRVNAQLTVLERRLAALDRKRATPSVGLGGGFSNIAGGGGGALGGGGGGGFGTAAKLGLAGAALLPGVQGLTGGAVALLGSASGAALGLGTAGVGGIGAFGVGAGLTASIVKPTVKGLEEIEKVQKKYTAAVERYGWASKQAAVARETLNRAEAHQPGAGAALRSVSRFKAGWRQATTGGRQAIYGAIGNVAAAGRIATPTLARAANLDAAATGGAASNFAGFLASPGSLRAVTSLSREFARDMPIAERSLENVTSTFEHLSVAARPFFHEGMLWVESWTHGLATSSSHEARVQSTMRGLVRETKDWGKLTKATFSTVRDLFNMGRPSGDSMVVSLTHTLDRWDTWIQRNPAKVRGFFKEAETTTSKVASALASIVHLLSQAATALGPIFNRAMSLISLTSQLGPTGTTAISALALGGYRGARGGMGGGGSGLLGAAVLGRSMGIGGSRMGGGTVIGRASGLEVGRGVTSSGTFLMGPASVGVAGVLARREAAARAATAGRFSGVRSSPLLGRLRGIGGGALAGAGKTLGLTMAAISALEAAGTGGSSGQILQNFGSGLTFGAIHHVDPTGGQGGAWASRFLGGIPSTLSPAAQQAVIQRKIARDLGQPFYASKGGFLGLGSQPTGFSGASVTPGGPNFRAQTASGLRQLEREAGSDSHTKSLIVEIKALRKADEEAGAAARDAKREHDALLNTKSEEHAQRISSGLGGAFKTETRHGRSTTGAFGDVTGGALSSMRQMREAGRKVLGENTMAWAAQLAKGNPQLAKPVQELTANIKRMYHNLGKDIQIVNGHILSGTKDEWANISTAMSEPIEKARERMSKAFTAIQNEAVGALVAMGFDRKGAVAVVAGMEKGGPSPGQISSKVQAGVGGAASAIIGGIGGKKHARGGVIQGHGLQDTVSVPGGKAAPGEAWIANRHTMNALSAATMAKWGKTAWQMIQNETRPHSMPSVDHGIMPGYARGGVVGNIPQMEAKASEIDSRHYPYLWGGGHNSAFSGPYDCSGAVSAVMHAGGAMAVPLVAASFMQYGLPGPGPVTTFANPGHVYMRIGAKYFGTSSANPGGGAGWFPGSPRPGFMERHIETTGSAGAVGASALPGGVAQAIHLKRRHSGMGGVPGLLADSGIASYTRALESRVNAHLGGGGVGGVHGKGGAPGANEKLGHRMMLAAGWPESEWPFLQKLWTQESGWDSRSVNSSSGAYGIPQALGHGHPFALGDAGAQIAWGLNYIRGRPDERTPQGAWAHEVSHGWYSRGGRSPAWGGWNAAGGSFETRGPTLFGAGEHGKRERVSITPAGSSNAGGGGHRIEVNIHNPTIASHLDAEAMAHKVAEKIIEELDNVGAGGVSDAELIGR